MIAAKYKALRLSSVSPKGWRIRQSSSADTWSHLSQRNVSSVQWMTVYRPYLLMIAPPMSAPQPRPNAWCIECRIIWAVGRLSTGTACVMYEQPAAHTLAWVSPDTQTHIHSSRSLTRPHNPARGQINQRADSTENITSLEEEITDNTKSDPGDKCHMITIVN